MLPTKPTRKAIGQTMTARRKNNGSSPRPILSQKSLPKKTIKRPKTRLCNIILITITKGLMPVSSKNFLSFPSTFFFKVSMTKAILKTINIRNGRKKKTGCQLPLYNWSTKRMPAITYKKTTINMPSIVPKVFLMFF